MFKKFFFIFFLQISLISAQEAEIKENLSNSLNSENEIAQTLPNEDKSQIIINSNLNLGFVNFRRIMSSLPQLSELKNSLNVEFKNQEEALKKAQDELEEMEGQNLENPSDNLAQRIIAKRREIARLESNYRDDYSVRRNEEIAKLQNLVMDEIIAMAKEKNFDVILNDNGVLFVSEKADLTQDVIKRLINKH